MAGWFSLSTPSSTNAEPRLLAQSSNRKMDYVARQARDSRAGKDIRIFNLSGWLLGILKQERKISEGYVKRW